MKQFGRSLLNPSPTAIRSMFATETSSGEPASNVTPLRPKHVNRSSGGMKADGPFCPLDSSEQVFRKAGPNGNSMLIGKAFA